MQMPFLLQMGEVKQRARKEVFTGVNLTTENRMLTGLLRLDDAKTARFVALFFAGLAVE